MAALPTGTLTFLFTDIAGSTRLWDTQHDAMKEAHARQADLIVAGVLAHRGQVVRDRGEGDSTFSVFVSPADALTAACAFQRALIAETWPTDTPIRVRAALHLGPAELREGDYNSTAVNRCARLRSLAAPGQILVSQAVAEAAGERLSEEITLRFLGSHRLKDLQLPEQVFQLCHPDLPDDFAPLRSLDTLPTNLPLQLTRFIGREAELGQVMRLLSPQDTSATGPPVHLLTLLGTGGAGKTRLALQAGAELLDDYPDGVWLVELASLADGALIAQSAATDLGLREEPGRTTLQTLEGYLHGRNLLLVLDNCEHLIGACASLAETLLRSCPHLTILVTSREPLNIAGETLWRIPSLSLPDETKTLSLESVEASEAAQLFVDRVQSLSPSFMLTDQNAPAIAQISRRLDGIPLALELAAARVRALSVEQIASRLDDRFRLLTGGSRTSLPRQQTLRALIDWSYDLLNESERTLLARLSVFSGGWTLEAAEQVCSDAGIESWEILDLLTSLVDKSLVLREEKDGSIRYRMLETVRQYATEKWKESGEETELRRRHRDWSLQFAMEGDGKLAGPEQARWLELLETEHDNLRQAIAFCLETPGEAKAGLQIVEALQIFWRTRGYYFEGRERSSVLLSHPDTQEPSQVRAAALNGTGLYAWRQGDYASARSLYEAAMTTYREIGDRLGMARSLSNLGMLAHAQCEYALARSMLEESIAIKREFGDKRSTAYSINGLGNIANDQGDYTLAASLYEESLAIWRELEDELSVAGSLSNLGNVAYFQGNYTFARSLYEEALILWKRIGDKSGIATTLNNLSSVAIDQGDYNTARSLEEESLAICRELGDRSGITISLSNLGNVAFYQGDYALARSLHEESLAIKRELNIQSGIAYSLNFLGRIAQGEEDFTQARALFHESLQIRKDLGEKMGIIECLEAHANFALAEGHTLRAAQLYGAAAHFREEIGASLPPKKWVNKEQRKARQALGKAAFTAAWSEGRALSWEQAIDLALLETAE